MKPEEILAMVPFAGTLGIDLEEASPEKVRGSVEWTPERCTSGGALHGGVLMSLADTLGAISAFLNLPDGATGTTTIESKTNFFRGVRSGKVSGTSRLLHAGRRTVVVQTDLEAEGKRVAQVTQTQAVLYPEA